MCRLRFERENDFFLGAYAINLGITEGLLAVAMFAYFLRLTANPGTSALPVLVVGGVLAVGGPVLFFPFSRTIWAAIDLAMRPVPPDDAEDTDAEE